MAFRAGLFSIGQAGQMILGAAATTSVGGELNIPYLLHIPFAILVGFLAGALWGWFPGLLKAYLGVNITISTLVLNQLSFFAVGFFNLGWELIPLRLTPLVRNTKFNLGILIAIAVTLFLYLYLRRFQLGYEERMSGDSARFALTGGIRNRRAISRAMFISGGIAGLAGAIEVVGVHYRFSSVFTGGGGFDGVAVALLGLANPLGMPVAAFILAGLRLGATNGLQLKAQVPRELGGAIIAMMIILVSTRGLYSGAISRFENWIGKLVRLKNRDDQTAA
jgi:simple sugar transport system permease protein